MANNTTKLNTFAILSFCFVAYSQTAINPIINQLILAYPDVTDSTARMVSTIPAISTFIFALLAGAFVGQKIGYRTLCGLSCIFWTIGGLMPIIINQQFKYILVSRLIFGIGTGFALCYNALIINTYPENQRVVMLGLAVLMVNAGSILTQIVAGYFGEIQWQYAFYVYIICPIEFFVVLRFLKEPLITHTNEEGKSGFNVRINGIKKTISFSIIVLIASLSIWPISSGMAIFVSDRNYGSSAIAGAILSVYTLGGALAGSMIKTTKKLNGYAIPIVFAVISVGFAIILMSNNLLLLALGAILCGMGYFSIKPMLTLLLSYELPKKTMAFSSTVLLAATNLGIFISNVWIELMNTMLAHFFNSELERSFFAGIVINALIAVMFYVCGTNLGKTISDPVDA